jgi:hypothetical protein
MRSVLAYISIALFFISCDAPFQLDLQQAPEKVIIEGLVTNVEAKQSVKVTRSTDFYSSGETPRITDAVVTVTDDEGNTFDFIHNPRNHVDSAGVYVPVTPFAGVIGRTYTLTVQAEGETFQATDEMFDVIPVDSITFEPDEDEIEDPEIEGRFYEVLLFAKEPQDVKNFYLFHFYRYDSLTFQNETDIYYSDDELLAENIDGVPGPIYYAKGDVAKIEIFSMSRVGFVYYNDLSSLLNGDSGGMFGPIPSSPRTNLSNGALGFFQVSAVNIAEKNLD